MSDRLLEYLNERKFEFYRNRSAAHRTSIKAGGSVDYFIIPNSAEEFVALIKYLGYYGVRFDVVGGMTNTLVATDAYRGALISTARISSVSISGSSAFVGAGVSLARLMSCFAASGVGGAEQLWLIPGTVGAAIRGNAGAHGVEMSDIVDYADVYFSSDDKVRRLLGCELDFRYRSSLAKEMRGAYILSAGVSLHSSSRAESLRRRRTFLQLRSASQPMKLNSLGCIFKKTDGVGAGYYIDRAGLKGLRLGGAEVSEVHAGFIVNVGGATWRDILSLIRICEERVRDVYGIALQREIEILR